jgi:hypothetical protein
VIRAKAEICSRCGVRQAPKVQRSARRYDDEGYDTQIWQAAGNTFTKLNGGGWIILISSCVALLSFFLPWVDIVILTRNGFSQGAVLFFLAYVYPLVMLFLDKPIIKGLGVLCGLMALGLTVAFIASKSDRMLDINVTGAGAYVFLLASIAFTVGVILYKSSQQQGEEAESVSRKGDIPEWH